MAHNHTHNHNDTTKNIRSVFFLNFFFVIIELLGGIYTNSVAILSDAMHDLGDCVSLAVSWGLQKKAAKKRDNHYSYGYKRFSLLGSVFLSGVLTVSSVIVIIEAAKRIATPQTANAEGMLWIAVFGVIVNGAAALKIKKGDSLNERAVFLHIMEDVLGWIAVLVVSVVMLFVNVPILDPILSIGISIWVLSNVYKNIKETFRIFLQAIPDNIDAERLEEEIRSIPTVESIHDLHVWTLDGKEHIMTLHVVASTNEKNKIRDEILKIATENQIHHSTIEFETVDTTCREKEA